MKKLVLVSSIGSISALGVAACCVLPMTMMLAGLGGSWLAVFGDIAAASYYVLGLSTALLVLSWMISVRRRSIAHLKKWLAGSAALTAGAWLLVIGETRINDFLITLM